MSVEQIFTNVISFGQIIPRMSSEVIELNLEEDTVQNSPHSHIYPHTIWLIKERFHN